MGEQGKRWAGWHRPSRREGWRKVAEAGDYTTCWGKLLDVLKAEGARGGESLVVEAGANPNGGKVAQQALPFGAGGATSR